MKAKMAIIILLICMVPALVFAAQPAKAPENDLPATEITRMVADEVGNKGTILSIGEGAVNINDVEYFFTANTRFYSVSGAKISRSSFRAGDEVRFLLDTQSTVGILIKLK
ncbi:MAG: hypothetical protein ACOZBW_02820 [Thermodesulfobacteriota bacterium]